MTTLKTIRSIMSHLLWIVLLFAVIVCGQRASPRAGSVTTPSDEAVSVTPQTQNSNSPSMSSCMGSQATSFKVRFQAIKTKTSSYSRLNWSLTTTKAFASEVETIAANNIAECSNAADGWPGFHFNNGTCTMFNIGFQICRCDATGSDVIFVQDAFWDDTGKPAVPELLPVGEEFLLKAKFQSALLNQANISNFPAIFIRARLLTAAEIQNSYMGLPPGLISYLCNEVECFYTMVMDYKACLGGCDSTSNWTYYQEYNVGSNITDESSPVTYMMSRCGETITLNETSAPTFRVSSHQGYGCQWYPKDGEDHECVVTVIKLSGAIIMTTCVFKLDGNSTSCLGDSVEIYNGTSAEGAPSTTITACSRIVNGLGPFNNMTIVFKRVARQYQEDGYNFGFTMYFL